MNPKTICIGCMEQDSGEPVCPKCGQPFELGARNSLQLKPRTLLHEQYVIGRALGHGGFGITYLAWDLGLEARLAIKEYIPNGVAGRAAGDTKVLAYSDQTQQEFDWGLDRFLEEARVLKRFHNHPGIVRIDTAFRDNGTAYLVMEFLDGMTFQEFLGRRGGKVAFETALRVILPVIDALVDVHREGILHRDISPDNIYLSKSGLVKLIDFGAARNALSQKSRNLSIILKEGYAPEEQYRASGIQGPWTDAYATAATLYHAITGKIPQPSLDRQAHDLVEWPSQLGVAIEPHAEAALMKALTVRSVDRFQSMEDFKAALTGAIDIAGATRPISQNDPRIKALERAAGAAAPPPPPPPAGPPQYPGQRSVQHSMHLGMPPPPGAMPLPPPPPPARATMGSSNPRWIWPAILGVAALVSIGGVIAFKSGGDTKKDVLKEKEVHGDDRKDVVKRDRKDVPPDDKDSNPDNKKDERKEVVRDDRKEAPKDEKRVAPPDNRPPDNKKDENKTVVREDRKDTPPDNNKRVDNKEVVRDDVPRDDRRTPPAQASGYEGLLQQARQVSSRNPNQAAQLLTQAIQMDVTKPDGYDALAEIQLYQMRELGPAVQNYKKALDRGGHATFHVYHDHGGGNFSRNCRGWLRVSHAGVSFEAFDSLHKFSGTRAQIFEARKNRWVGGSIFMGGGNGHATVDPNAFHIRLQGKDGPNYNLAPMSAFSDPERSLILDILGRN